MQQSSVTTSNGETSAVADVAVVDKATSRDPEAEDDANDTKMASANNSIAEDMSISTLSVELSPKPPSSARADQQQEDTSTSVPAAAAAVDDTSACPIDESATGADPSANGHEDKAEASDEKTSSNSEPAKSLPTFPALPSSGAVSDTTRQEPQSSAGSPTKSTADDDATSTTTSGKQPKLETPPSPSIAIAKRPKPGGVASSSKLRAASMPNNPNRGDGSSTTGSTTSSTAAAPAANVTPLRRGKWTKEEEEYAAMVIQMFNAGYLPAPAGTTLRAYLSDKLHCDPMRITKKFTGSSCIGKRVFHPAVRCADNAAAMDSAQEELVALEKSWRKRLKLKKSSSRRSSSKREPKAAAGGTTSATSLPSFPASTTAGTVGHHANPATTTATNPATTTTTGIVSPPAVSPPSEEWSAGPSSATYATGSGTQQRATETTSTDSSPRIPPSAARHHGASWIDRANALLGNGVRSTNNNGPSSENSYARRKVSDSSHISHEDGAGKEHQQTVSSPNSDATVTPSEAKDAEALVGFLNSVRAEAASSGGL